jgi:SAM-dependent methyltransferase
VAYSAEQLYYENPDHWRSENYDRTEQERVRSTMTWIPSDVGSVLDVGCGNGLLTNRFQDRFDTFGVDRSIAALRWVEVPCSQANVASLPFDEDAFDIVIATEVIEHLPTPVIKLALSEMVRVTRRYILLSVPYCENLARGRVVCPACGCRFHRSYHMRRFSFYDIKNLFAGWENVEFLHAKGVSEKAVGFPTLQRVKDVFQYMILGRAGYTRARFPVNTVCPQCHYAQSGVSVKRQIPSQLRRLRRWMKKTFRWWFVLYRQS